MSTIVEALRASGAMRGRFGSAFRDPAPLAESGDYLVRIIVGGQKLSQVLRVERVSGTNDSAIADTDDAPLDPKAVAQRRSETQVLGHNV